MPPTPPPAPHRWFRRLLALLPFDTQREYGRDMERTFLTEYRSEASSTKSARWRVWLRTIVGLLSFASREQWEATRSDLAYAVRGWRRSPGLFLLLFGTIGVGITGVTVAFALVDAVVLRPLSVPEPSTFLRVTETHEDVSGSTNLTYAAFLDLEADPGSLRAVAASRFWFANLTGQGEPERLQASLVSGDYFVVLGARANHGRLLTDEDNSSGQTNVIVISDALWQRRFGGDRSLIGSRLEINGRSMEVVGVLPPGVGFPLGTEIWAPLVARQGGLATNRGSHQLEVVARLRAGASLAAARRELTVKAQQMDEAFPGIDPEIALSAEPALDRIVAPVRVTLWTTLAGAMMLLIVLGMNVAHVQLARASGRTHEFAVRTALGASRSRIARLLLTETLALSVISGVAGLLAAWLTIDALPSVLPADLPRAARIVFDWRAATAGLTLATISGLLFGAWPALRVTRIDRLNGSRGVRGSREPGRILATAQLAMTFALLVLAGLVVRSATAVSALPLGFAPEGVVRVDMSLSQGRVPPPADGNAYVAVFDPILRRIEAIPGVTATGLTTTPPFGPGASTSFLITGEREPDGREPSADIRIVDPGFFRVLGVRVLSGRTFRADDSPASQPVMVISATLARRHFGDRDPVGRSITMLGWGSPRTAEVIGVVGDVVGGELEAEANPTIYWHYPQFPQLFVLSLFAHTNGDEQALTRTIREAIWELEPNQPLPTIEPMTASIRQAKARRSTLTWLLAGLAGTAVAFALVGIYGVLAHKAVREQSAHGVRLALGARPSDIARLVMREAARVAAVGLVVGAFLALVVGRVVEALLFNTAPTDAPSFLVAALLVSAATAAAALGPAWRASRVDPAVVLRRE